MDLDSRIRKLDTNQSFLKKSKAIFFLKNLFFRRYLVHLMTVANNSRNGVSTLLVGLLQVDNM